MSIDIVRNGNSNDNAHGEQMNHFGSSSKITKSEFNPFDIITNNPYRVLGLPISSSERDITKRISDMKIYAEMGKIKTFETDFLFIEN